MMVFPGELDGGGARELSCLEIWAGVFGSYMSIGVFRLSWILFPLKGGVVGGLGFFSLRWMKMGPG
jgi:hypothetical protein